MLDLATLAQIRAWHGMHLYSEPAAAAPCPVRSGSRVLEALEGQSGVSGCCLGPQKKKASKVELNCDNSICGRKFTSNPLAEFSSSKKIFDRIIS